MLTVGSAFTGIGGFDLAAERAGTHVVWQIERDRFCNRVLAARWPEVERHGDITTVDPARLAAVDVLCGGFPCQDLSVAGRRAGLAGTRSGLFHELIRLVAVLRPAWVCIENVPGLLSSSAGRDMGTILHELAKLGYGLAWRSLDAQYDGLAQRRQRVFIVGCLGGPARAAQVLFEPESCAWDSAPRRAAGQDAPTGAVRSIGAGGPDDSRAQAGMYVPVAGGQTARYGKGTDSDVTDALIGVAHTLRADDFDASEDGTGRGTPLIVAPFDMQQVTSRANQQRIEEGRPSPTLHENGGAHVIAFTEHTRKQGRTFEAQENLAYALTNPGSGGRTQSRQLYDGMAVRRLTPLECERLQGFPDGWTCLCEAMGATWTCRCPDGPRYRALGNAAAVPVAAWVLRRIAEAEAEAGAMARA